MYRKKIQENAGNVPEVPEYTCKSGCPFPYRTIVKRHVITGSRLEKKRGPGGDRKLGKRLRELERRGEESSGKHQKVRWLR
jgi:hypothetical protein